ncbi:uncharacterized protein F4812DRAFT_130255 [Daldinia caldariorum]|uniref:uncharacterized protein n=1 Tax=Daldinia caldariorum TaxID=326644 RepID=UPI002008D60E|nr:uncharacterized protein F4812DRAFT_130255 [Daldinia caldariorum]KAI1465064.1 hypothetical protein F4812DRAFT_130255 [Daldinia caldariorum]
MSNSQNDDGPPLLRPIPRRPFNLIPREPTPPNDDSPAPIVSADPGHVPLLNLESLNSRLLNMRNTDLTPESTTISRTDSSLNLTGSTLAGIYSPSIWGKDKFDMGVDEPGTPWGTGADTPAKNLRADEPNYKIQKERALSGRRRSSLHPVVRPPPLSTAQRVFYHGLRSLLLFGLGVLYGMLAVQLRDRQMAVGPLEMHNLLRSADGGYNWGYLAFSGVCGIVMGILLPWFDGVWERVFGSDDVAVESPVEQSVEDQTFKRPASFTDWALAIREKTPVEFNSPSFARVCSRKPSTLVYIRSFHVRLSAVNLRRASRVCDASGTNTGGGTKPGSRGNTCLRGVWSRVW